MSGAAWLAVLAVALGTLLLRAAALRGARRDRRRLGELALLRRFAPLPGPGREWTGAVMLAAAAALLAAVAAGLGAREAEREERQELETVLVLDASNSMLAEDVSPSRLGRQRALAADLAARLPGKIGVVYFAGRGYVLSPLTVDASAIRMFVEAVRPASVGRGGTSLASGLSEALAVLAGGREGAARSVVLFSDGEETVDRPLEDVLARAARAGVAVHAVGIGTAEGASIPLGPDAAVEPGSLGESYGTRLRDPEGEVVVTRLEEEALRRIAGETGGRYLAGEPGPVAALAAEVAAGAPRGRSAGGAGLGAAGWLLVAMALLWLEAFGLRRAPARRAAAALPALALAAGLGAGLASLAWSPVPPAAQEPTAQEPPRPGPEDAEDPVARYRAEAARSGEPRDWYNFGTALLLDGRWEDAAEPLRRATGGQDERLRAYGGYNHGLARALSGQHGEGPTEARREALLAARSSFREVLRTDPADEDARWNLELVDRWLRSPPLAGGGGEDEGGGGADGARDEGGLDREEAEALLERAGQAEAELRERVLERGRLRDPSVERNW